MRFLGHVSDPVELATLQASVDVAIAPGPVETFGLAALETLAGGTPVVVGSQSALPEVTGSAGLAAGGEGPAYATAIQEIMSPVGGAARGGAGSGGEVSLLVGVGGGLPRRARRHRLGVDRAGTAQHGSTRQPILMTFATLGTPLAFSANSIQ